MRSAAILPLLVLLTGGALLGACGDDGASARAGDQGAAVMIAVTTPVLGDIVSDLVGDLAEVFTIMPRGANPHDFQASAQQAGQLATADVIVQNGGGFEAALQSVVEGAEGDGVPVLDALELLGTGGDHAGEGEAHGDHDLHEDAHFFTDPLAVVAVVEALAAELPEVAGLDEQRLGTQAEALVGELESLHADLESTLADIPEERRILVTDHDVFGSFAERYGFEVIATVIPTGSTSDGVSGGDLAQLARLLRDTGVSTVFTEGTASGQLAETLADEVGDVAVVALHAETLGPEGSGADTYASMMSLNATRIADALAAG